MRKYGIRQRPRLEVAVVPKGQLIAWCQHALPHMPCSLHCHIRCGRHYVGGGGPLPESRGAVRAPPRFRAYRTDNSVGSLRG